MVWRGVWSPTSSLGSSKAEFQKPLIFGAPKKYLTSGKVKRMYIFCLVALIQSFNFVSDILRKRSMILMKYSILFAKYSILFATVPTITEIFFPISIATIVKETISSRNYHYHSGYGYQAWQDGELPWQAPTHKVTQPFGHMVLQDHVKNKTIISSLPKCLWLANLVGLWLALMASHLYSYSTPTSCGLERSRDKLKPLYLHYHKAYDHQTWIVGDLTCEASIQIVTSSFNHVVLLDHTTN